MWLPIVHPPSTGDVAHNRGMCPDWEANLEPSGSQACTQSTEPHQPGLFFEFFKNLFVIETSSIKHLHLKVLCNLILALFPIMPVFLSYSYITPLWTHIFLFFSHFLCLQIFDNVVSLDSITFLSHLALVPNLPSY